MNKRIGISAFIGLLLASLVGQPVVSFAHQAETMGERAKGVLNHPERLLKTADQLRELGAYYSERKAREGVEAVRLELRTLFERAAQEEMAKVEGSSDLSSEQKGMARERIERQLMETAQDLETTTNFNAFFSEKASRLIDRDVNGIPFEDDDDGWESLVDIFLLIAFVGIVLAIIAAIAYDDDDDHDRPYERCDSHYHGHYRHYHCYDPRRPHYHDHDHDDGHAPGHPYGHAPAHP